MQTVTMVTQKLGTWRPSTSTTFNQDMSFTQLTVHQYATERPHIAPQNETTTKARSWQQWLPQVTYKHQLARIPSL